MPIITFTLQLEVSDEEYYDQPDQFAAAAKELLAALEDQAAQRNYELYDSGWDLESAV